MHAGGKRARKQERSRNAARRRGPAPAHLRGSSGPEQGSGEAGDSGNDGGAGEDGGDGEEYSVDEDGGDEQPIEDGEAKGTAASCCEVVVVPQHGSVSPCAFWQRCSFCTGRPAPTCVAAPGFEIEMELHLRHGSAASYTGCRCID